MKLSGKKIIPVFENYGAPEGTCRKKFLFRARAHEVASRSHEEFFSACPAGFVKNVVGLANAHKHKRQLLKKTVFTVFHRPQFTLWPPPYAQTVYRPIPNLFIIVFVATPMRRC